MIDDDDLPVLTQVLRTGDGRGPARSVPAAGTSEATAESVTRSLDGSSATDPLVIGNDPHPDDAVATPFDDDEGHDPARFAVSDDAGADSAADSFSLPQDHDLAHAIDASATRLDEPEIDAPMQAADERAERRAVPFVADEPRERRVHPFAAGEPRERRADAFPVDRPRERRTNPDDISLQRLASITSSVRDSVLVALQTRIDTELDARIAQAMHREVETAIAQLQDKLRDRLTEALRDVVARAVDEEMNRFVAAERDATARLDPRKPPSRPDA